MDTQPNDNADLSALETILDYSFQDKDRLRWAMTHSSSTADKTRDNERLEFFGDAILDYIICAHLFDALPQEREGRLTEIKAAIVCRKTLAEAANALGLRPFLILGKGIAQNAKLPQSLFGNVFEAIVAAIYLDGGMEAARTFVLKHLAPMIERAQHRSSVENYKSKLQEILQAARHPSPEYRTTSAHGPDHRKEFKVVVELGDRQLGAGSGSSKKEAEQAAAQDALTQLDITTLPSPDDA